MDIEKIKESLTCLVPSIDARKTGSVTTCHEKSLCDCSVLEIINYLEFNINYWKQEALGDFSESKDIIREFLAVNKDLELAKDALVRINKTAPAMYKYNEIEFSMVNIAREALKKL